MSKHFLNDTRELGQKNFIWWLGYFAKCVQRWKNVSVQIYCHKANERKHNSRQKTIRCWKLLLLKCYLVHDRGKYLFGDKKEVKAQ